jgi:hypothetical protein
MQPCSLPQTGGIHVGENDNPNTHWICDYHREKWDAQNRFIAGGLPCAMEEL